MLLRERWDLPLGFFCNCHVLPFCLTLLCSVPDFVIFLCLYVYFDLFLPVLFSLRFRLPTSKQIAATVSPSGCLWDAWKHNHGPRDAIGHIEGVNTAIVFWILLGKYMVLTQPWCSGCNWAHRRCDNQSPSPPPRNTKNMQSKWEISTNTALLSCPPLFLFLKN